jgi:hypothetical protein
LLVNRILPQFKWAGNRYLISGFGEVAARALPGMRFGIKVVKRRTLRRTPKNRTGKEYGYTQQ